MQRAFVWSLLLLVAQLGLLRGASRGAKNVQVSLEAPWGVAPLVLEASEFFSGGTSDGDGDELFWRYATAIPANALEMSDKDQYESALSAARTLVSNARVDILKYALSLRNYSPKLQAFAELWAHAEASGCKLGANAVAVIAGSCIKEPSEVKDALAAIRPGGKTPPDDVNVLSFDHVYGGSTSTGGAVAPTVLLYAAIGTPSFLSFHAELTKLVDAGTVRYVLRHAWPARAPARMPLQGYGVELAIKNMEYKTVDDRDRESSGKDGDAVADQEDTIDGFDFMVLIGRREELMEDLTAFRDTLREDVLRSDSTELKVWNLKDIGIQASQRVMSAEEPLRLIRDLSHNLPSMVSSLSRMRVNQQVKAEIEGNQQYLHPGANLVLLNGRQLDVEAMSPYQLLDVVRHETALIEELTGLGIDAASGRKLLNAPNEDARMGGMMGGQESRSFRLDIREEAFITWMNDLERDDTYAKWPRDLGQLLQRGWPGRLRFVARNLYTALFVIDPADFEGLQLAAEAFQMIQQQMPFRAGIIFASLEQVPASAETRAPAGKGRDDNSNDDGDTSAASATEIPPAVRFFRLFHALMDRHGREAAFTFLASHSEMGMQPQSSAKIQLQQLKANFKGTVKQFPAKYRNSKGKPDRARWNSACADASRDIILKESTDFIRTAGLQVGEPVIVVNGHVMQGKEAEINQFMHQLSVQQVEVQRGVYFGKLMDHADLYPQIIKLAGGAYRRFHPQIVPGTARSDKMISAVGVSALVDAARFHVPGYEDTSTTRPISHIVAVDLATPVGRELALAALKRLSQSSLEHSGMVRLALLHNGAAGSNPEEALLVLQEAQRTWKDKKTAQTTAAKILRLATNVTALLEAGEWAVRAPKDPTIAPLLAAVRKFVPEGFPAGTVPPGQQAAAAQAAFGVAPGDCAVATAGRIFFVSADSRFMMDDFTLSEATEFEDRVRHVHTTLERASFPGVNADTVTSDWLSSLALKASLIVLRQRLKGIQRQEIPQQWKARLTGFYAGGSEEALLQVTAAVDPLCKAAQRIAPLLMALAKAFGARVHVVLNPQADTTSLPIKGYFRYVLKTFLEFDAHGEVIEAHRASFSGLPESKLLSMQLHPPHAWFVEAEACRHDMDNIQLDQLGDDEQVLSATYRLDRILLTGHCGEERYEPPAGLQLQLLKASTTGTQRVLSDTIVMSNLGYFQLKAQPGVFSLTTAKGRSREMYAFWDNDDNTHDEIPVAILTWEPQVIMLRAKRRPGYEMASLRDRVDEAGGGERVGASIWSSIESMFGYESDDASGPGDAAGEEVVALKPSELETIHVFSLASGHLYERFLKIMMLSVVQNTKNPVKFWLLRNFLSPAFKNVIPKMAARHGFEYELVTYKWPSWLHQQTEKQRIIWGYKVLMLDVLFPLSVPKIIYIDSDQVVRADVQELWNMDLKGKPYAYTPFCDNKKEIEGFRFWKQGFWAQHLGTSKYHISALYVVDLRRFRELGAGDTLRMVYSQLSRDPNSLANLDQDLPNYAQHQVPIFSLPQEWLWCETWCSNSTLATAKTIDLCNNPMTKEPKLDQARRIVKEWEKLDSIANFPVPEARQKEASCSQGDHVEQDAAPAA